MTYSDFAALAHVAAFVFGCCPKRGQNSLSVLSAGDKCPKWALAGCPIQWNLLLGVRLPVEGFCGCPERVDDARNWHVRNAAAANASANENCNTWRRSLHSDRCLSPPFSKPRHGGGALAPGFESGGGRSLKLCHWESYSQ
jgi:hypothetical protein